MRIDKVNWITAHNYGKPKQTHEPKLVILVSFSQEKLPHTLIAVIASTFCGKFAIPFFSGPPCVVTYLHESVSGQLPRRTIPPGTTPNWRLPRRTTPPQDDSPGGNNNNNNNNNDNTGHLSCGGVVLRGRRPPGELSCGGVVLRGSCQVGVIPGGVVLEPHERYGWSNLSFQTHFEGFILFFSC